MYLVQVREEVGVIPPKEVRPGDIVPVRHCPVEEAVFLGGVSNHQRRIKVGE